jgi:hypothetical protein
MDSEEFSDDSSGFDSIEIDKFHTESIDEILDMYYEFKNRFSYDPFFLGNLQSTDLTEFFTDLLFVSNVLKMDKYCVINNEFVSFNEEYQNELSTSFSFAHSFLLKYDFNLPSSIWAFFCFKHSIID